VKLMAATKLGPIFSSLFLVSSGISPLEKSTGRTKLFPSDKSASGYKKEINKCQILRVSVPIIIMVLCSHIPRPFPLQPGNEARSHELFFLMEI